MRRVLAGVLACVFAISANASLAQDKPPLKLGGILDVTVNDFHKQVELPQGATKGSRQGDASGEPTSLRPAAIEFDLAEDTLKEGENQLVFTLREGGWLAWDALGIFAK